MNELLANASLRFFCFDPLLLRWRRFLCLLERGAVRSMSSSSSLSSSMSESSPERKRGLFDRIGDPGVVPSALEFWFAF